MAKRRRKKKRYEKEKKFLARAQKSKKLRKKKRGQSHARVQARQGSVKGKMPVYENLKKACIHILLVGEGGVSSQNRFDFYHASFDPDFFKVWKTLAENLPISTKLRVVSAPLSKSVAVGTIITNVRLVDTSVHNRFTILGELEYDPKRGNPHQAVEKIAKIVGSASDLVIVTHPMMMYSLMAALREALGIGKSQVDELRHNVRYIIINPQNGHKS